MPENARFVRADEIDERDYDFAILHFDENVLSPENTNGVIGPDWGRAFQWCRENLTLPKIAVCHGTPQFYGQYNINYAGPDLMHVIEPERVKLVDYLDDVTVVCNSHQAQREWQFNDSHVIWHGFDPAEFPPATYERESSRRPDRLLYRALTIEGISSIERSSAAMSMSSSRKASRCRSRTCSTAGTHTR